MPRMNILNTVEREAFSSPPVFSSFQRKQYFDFPSKLRRWPPQSGLPAWLFTQRRLPQSREEVLLTRLFPPAGYRLCGAPARARSADGRLRPISSSRPPTSPAHDPDVLWFPGLRFRGIPPPAQRDRWPGSMSSRVTPKPGARARFPSNVAQSRLTLQALSGSKSCAEHCGHLLT